MPPLQLKSDVLTPEAGRPKFIGNLGTMTSGYRLFGNRRWTFASLTGGTQFVTVNQSFTKTFGRAKFCRQLELQTSRYLRLLVAVLVGKGAREFPFPRWERSPKKSGGPNRRSAT